MQKRILIVEDEIAIAELEKDYLELSGFEVEVANDGEAGLSKALKGNYDPDKFKVYFCDTGLFVSLLDDEAQEDLRANKNLDVYKGALYESIVGEALVKSGYDLYYYKKENATLEQDFFVRTANNLVPVEVKSSNNKTKSLKALVESEKYEDIAFGIKFCAGNIGRNDNVYTFPYYCTFLFKRYLKEKYN